VHARGAQSGSCLAHILHIPLPHPSPPWFSAALISEGILVTPTMMAHHRLFVLAEAFEVCWRSEEGNPAAVGCC
jgi:hypothetical protein